MAFRELLGIDIDERGDGRAKLLFRANEEHLEALEAEVTQKESGEHIGYATATFTILQS